MAGDDEEKPPDGGQQGETLRDSFTEQLAPANIQAHYDLAVSYAQMGLLTDAIQEFERVLRIQPGHDSAQVKLSELRSRLRGTDPPDDVA